MGASNRVFHLTGSLLLWENGDRVAVERVDFVVELEHI